jgi:competence protein ComEC
MLAAWLTHGVPWQVAHPGRRWQADGVRLTVLAPGPGRHTVNDGSVVVRLDFGGFSALLTGDAEGPSEHAMLGAHAPLAATVLKVGHHGSPTSTSPDFLAAVQPRLAVVSVGRHNRFGHPGPAVMRRLRAAGVAIARTDLAGCVRVRSDGHIWAWATGPDEGAAWHSGGQAAVDAGSRRD